MSSSAGARAPAGGLRHAADGPARPELLVQDRTSRRRRTRSTRRTRTSRAPTSRSGATSRTSATTAASASSTSRGPKPKLVADERCYGPQGDPSVFDRNRDGRADTLVLRVDSVLRGPRAAAQGPAAKDARPASIRAGALGGPAGLRHLESGRPAADRDRLPGLRLAHEHAAARAGRQVDVRAQLELPARRRPDVRPARQRPGPQGQPRRRPGHRGAVPGPDGGRASSRSCRSSTRVTPTASTSRSATTASSRRSTTSSAATT